jgi:hypothetical protein
LVVQASEEQHYDHVEFLERIGPGEDLWSLDPNDIYHTVITSLGDYQRRHAENSDLIAPEVLFNQKSLPVLSYVRGEYWIRWEPVGGSQLRHESEITHGNNVFLRNHPSELDTAMLALGEVISSVLPYAEVREPDSIRRAMASILNSDNIKLVVVESGVDSDFDRDFDGRPYLLEISYAGDRFARVSLRGASEFSAAIVRF